MRYKRKIRVSSLVLEYFNSFKRYQECSLASDCNKKKRYEPSRSIFVSKVVSSRYERWAIVYAAAGLRSWFGAQNPQITQVCTMERKRERESMGFLSFSLFFSTGKMHKRYVASHLSHLTLETRVSFYFLLRAPRGDFL